MERWKWNGKMFTGIHQPSQLIHPPDQQHGLQSCSPSPQLFEWKSGRGWTTAGEAGDGIRRVSAQPSILPNHNPHNKHTSEMYKASENGEKGPSQFPKPSLSLTRSQRQLTNTTPSLAGLLPIEYTFAFRKITLLWFMPDKCLKRLVEHYLNWPRTFIFLPTCLLLLIPVYHQRMLVHTFLFFPGIMIHWLFSCPNKLQGRGRNMPLLSDWLRHNMCLSSVRQLLDKSSEFCSRLQSLLSVNGLPSQSSILMSRQQTGSVGGRCGPSNSL